MSELPRTMEWEEYTSDDMTNPDGDHDRAEAMHNELLARIAALEEKLSIEQQENRRLRERLKRVETARPAILKTLDYTLLHGIELT